MANKGKYEISDVRPSKDGSFRSMLCAMLVFLAFCAIILLVVWLVKPSKTNEMKSDTSLNYTMSSIANKLGGEKSKQLNHTVTAITQKISSTTEQFDKEEKTTKSVTPHTKKETTVTPKEEKTTVSIIKNEATTSITTQSKVEITTSQKKDKSTTASIAKEIEIATTFKTLLSESTTKKQDETRIPPIKIEVTTTSKLEETTTPIIAQNKDEILIIPQNKDESTTEKIEKLTKLVAPPNKIEVATTTKQEETTAPIIAQNKDEIPIIPQNKDESTTASKTEVTEKTTKLIIPPIKVEVTTTSKQDETTTPMIAQNKDEILIIPQDKDETSTTEKTEKTTKLVAPPNKIGVATTTKQEETTTPLIAQNKDKILIIPQNKDETSTTEKTEKTTKLVAPPNKVEVATTTKQEETTTPIIAQNKDEIPIIPQNKDESTIASTTEKTEKTTKLVAPPNKIEVATTTKQEETTTPMIAQNKDEILIIRQNKDESSTASTTEKTEKTTKLVAPPNKVEVATTTKQEETTTTIIAKNKDEIPIIPPNKDESTTASTTEKTEKITKLITSSIKVELTTTSKQDESTTPMIAQNKDEILIIPQNKDETSTASTTEKTEKTTKLVAPPNIIEVATTPKQEETTTPIIVQNKDEILIIPQNKDLSTTESIVEITEKTTKLVAPPIKIEVATPPKQDETTTPMIVPNKDEILIIPQNKVESTTVSSTVDKIEVTSKPVTPSIINEVTTTSEQGKTTISIGTENRERATTLTLEQSEITPTNSIKSSSISNVYSYYEPTEKSYSQHYPPPDEEYSSHPYDSFSKSHVNTFETCSTPNCKTVASQMLAQMNYHVDKCDDSFYDYTCGGYQIDKEEIIWSKINEKLEAIDGESSKNVQIFGSYYDMCVDHQLHYSNDTRIDEVKNLLNSIVSSDISATNQDEDLTKLLATLMLNDYVPLFDISVDINNETGNFEFQLILGRENTILEEENHVFPTQKKCILDMKAQIATLENVNMNSKYKQYLNCKNNFEEYVSSVMESAKILNLESINNDPDFASRFKSFLRHYKILPKPDLQRINLVTKNYELKRISQLNTDYPLIKWKSLLRQLVDGNVEEDTLIQVYFGSYFTDLFKFLNTLSKKNLYEILHAMFANNLYRTLAVPAATSDAEKLCLKQTSNLLKEVSSSMYLDAVKGLDLDSHINEINIIFDELKNELNERLNDANWLEEEPLKLSMSEKLNNMTLVTNMAVWNNESIIDARMEDLPNYILNYQQFSNWLVQRYRRMIYKMWNQPGDNPEYIWWHYQTVYGNKFVPIYALNTVVISPVKLLEIPKDIPDYIRLAKIYYLLGKAIGHHFDNTGIQYNIILEENTAKSYEYLQTCSADKIKKKQTIKFKGKLLEYEIKDTLATLSLNNRIAEDLALKLTEDIRDTKLRMDEKIIWLSTYTPENILFIALAQEHCKKLSIEDLIIQLFENDELPPPILLKTILPNLDAFAEIVKCPEGSNMHDPILCPALQDLDKHDEKK